MAVSSATDSCPDLQADHLSIHERVAAAIAPLAHLDFDGLRDQAAPALERLLPGARLTVLDQLHATDTFRQGKVMLPEYGPSLLELYMGPPEPLWLITHDIPEAPGAQLLASLYSDRLLSLMTAAGYAEELARQARRDWLTGLPTMKMLERDLRSGTRSDYVLAIIALNSGPEAGGPLALRTFAHRLRGMLTEDDHAYSVDDQRIVLLVPTRERPRFDAFLLRSRLALKHVWVQLTEAPGLEVLRLAEARLLTARPNRVEVPVSNVVGVRAPVHNLNILSGSVTAGNLARNLMQDWHFDVPLTLILDLPLGYALTTLPSVSTSSLVVTGQSSIAYLLDLQDLQPDGLVVEPEGIRQLRGHLERVAAGHRVYSGPILDDPGLLPREREVWRLVARGLENSQIASELGISAKTAANYVSSLVEKLQQSDRTGLLLSYWGRVN